MCGKDASDSRIQFDRAYCTTSGGGGQYGWNDDGSPMTGTGRYRIFAAQTDQCGQHEASWKQATSIIQWNDSWVGPDDQVVLDTNPPAPEDCGPQEPAPESNGTCSAFPEPPTPNPVCETEVCDIYDRPYYAKKGKNNWVETNGYIRHQVKFQGWSPDETAAGFLFGLRTRCHTDPRNYRPYFQGDVHVVDFELPHSENNDLCWCIADAVYDASVGISIDRNTWCEGATYKAPKVEFNTVGGKDELRKRSNGPFNIVGEKPVKEPKLKRFMASGSRRK
ncbi:MAG: hypothetical protein Q9170_007627 [Blastenia crenularia]